jgi:ubiquitin C-terminal hydrolase
LLRASPTASPIDDASRQAGTRKSRRSVDRNVTEEDDAEFCALCAFESHIQQVHDSSQSKDKPVAPEAFIKGFVNHVAPWMRIGIQEDSHEFLRLLIDAMQKSCVKARNKGVNPQESPSAGDNTKADSGMSPEDKEYPFSLFRGTVESNVTCENCNASSSTMDPIEDIGLEVTVQSSASDSVSPSPLTDVQTAFSRFARTESLDGNYKCEKCGKVGRATKQSRLATIPPILTLHLKRFRYGDSGRGSDAIFRRSGRSEVKSGSAKIDGHIKFDVCLDLKPYLTKEMQSKTKSGMLCRLFAVVVHAGKNSNSGH